LITDKATMIASSLKIGAISKCMPAQDLL